MLDFGYSVFVVGNYIRKQKSSHCFLLYVRVSLDNWKQSLISPGNDFNFNVVVTYVLQIPRFA
jgi:hypothetical protein